MAPHARFALSTLDDLRAALGDLGLALPISEDLTPLGEPLEVEGRRLPNRFAVHPMEGFDSAPDGAPTALTFRRYRRFAEGGAGLIWFEGTAVLEEGRSNPHQLWLHEATVGPMAALVAETRRAAREAFGWEPLLLVQLTHSGRYSRPGEKPQPIIAHHDPALDARHGLGPETPLVSDASLDALPAVFARAAELARAAGFDGVDVKACHRYLFSELLAAHTREGRYGGSYENRTRIVRETLRAVREAVPELLATTRLNAYDGLPYPHGWGVDREDPARPDLSEVHRLVAELAEDGLALLNVTVGNPAHNPHLNRPYDRPAAGGYLPAEHPLEGVARLLGLCAALQAAHPTVAVVATGFAWLRHLMPQVAAGMLRAGQCALVGQGRGAFAYPDSPRDILETGAMDPARCCVACSHCSQLMRRGGPTGCIVRDREGYGPEARRAR